MHHMIRACGLLLFIASSACAAEPIADPQAQETPKTRGSEWHEQLTPYGRLDLVYSRYTQDGAATKGWNLNGLRDTVLGVATTEHEPGSGGITPVGALEVGFGADRGENGRDYTMATRQAYAGLSGDWGKLTVGRQYSLMTNIAWSVLNPIAQGWGSYANDLLYAGDPFTHGQLDAADVQAAGSNFFYGYAQSGLIYQQKSESYTLEVDHMPGSTSRKQGKTIGIGGTIINGKLTLAAAMARQHALHDGSHRDNHVIGGVYAIDEHVDLHLARLASKTSMGSRYTNLYGGFRWQASDKLTVSAAFSHYRQNTAATYGAGRSLGFASVLEYTINEHLTVYLEADRRNHRGADDGLMLTLPDVARTRNMMVGLYASF